MCGIAGIISSGAAGVDRSVLGRMAARLVHRGPDDEGLWIEPAPGDTPPRVGMAVRRLAVIDPAGSRQPLSNEDGTVWLAQNGEIYNYRDLRAELQGRGHVLRTAGDTETLVHLYEDHGADLVQRLVGMFAFALWDGRRRRLLLARDRLGQKPLYWWHGPAGLVFASEMAALLECPDVPRSLDRDAIAEFLRFGYVPAPATGLVGVQKLPPAHYLIYDAATGQITGPTRYWDVPRGPADDGPSAAEWQERLRATLAEAVRSQLVADVPVGVLLSGGLDSSIITALAAENAAGRPLHTFTVRFAESGWDESAYARAVADRYGTQHTEVQVEPDAIEALEKLVPHYGEPFADSSAIAMHYLAREARRNVTVALSGDGGDESFGGYPRHGAMLMSERMGPRLRQLLAWIGRRMSPHADRKSRWNAARRFLSALDLDPLPRYLAWRSLFSGEQIAALINKGGMVIPAVGVTMSQTRLGGFKPPPCSEQSEHGHRNGANDHATHSYGNIPPAWLDALRGLDSRPWVDRAMAIDLADYLPNDCLAKVDIASMRHSLEVRSPFLDHRLVELARRMPADLKWSAPARWGRPPQGKAILRDALSDRLPPAIAHRGKMGFGVPVGRWLAGPHAEWMRGILLDPRTLGRGLFDRWAVEWLIDDHTHLRADHGDRLWALVCLELWMRWAGV